MSETSMRLEQLQAFLLVAETGSFQQAARQLGVTQSTISRQIQALEGEVGLSLFHRSSQAKLTLGGERLWPYARKICQSWDNATEEIGALIAGKQPELCVAAIHSVCATYLPSVLEKFCRNYPEVQLRVTALGSDRALKVLKDGLVDVAIVMNNRFLTATPEMRVEALYTEAVEILMAANHPLAEYEQVPISELVRYPQVVFKDGYGMQRLVQHEFGRIGAKLNAVLELNTLDAFRGVVRQGNLIALLPHSALREVSSDPMLAIRSIAPGSGNPKVSSIKDSLVNSAWKREVVLVTTSDRMEIPPIKLFWQLVKELVPQQLDELDSFPGWKAKIAQ